MQAGTSIAILGSDSVNTANGDSEAFSDTSLLESAEDVALMVGESARLGNV